MQFRQAERERLDALYRQTRLLLLSSVEEVVQWLWREIHRPLGDRDNDGIVQARKFIAAARAELSRSGRPS